MVYILIIEVIRLRPQCGRKHVQVGNLCSVLLSEFGGGRNFSDYYKQMDETAKKRYSDKLDRIALEVDDPYTLKASKRSDIVPNIEFPDIYNFFNMAGLVICLFILWLCMMKNWS